MSEVYANSILNSNFGLENAFESKSEGLVNKFLRKAFQI